MPATPGKLMYNGSLFNFPKSIHSNEKLKDLFEMSGVFDHHTHCIRCGHEEDLQHRRNWLDCKKGCICCTMVPQDQIEHVGQSCPHMKMVYPHLFTPMWFSKHAGTPVSPWDPLFQAMYDRVRKATGNTERSRGQQVSQVGRQPASQNSKETSKSNTQDHWPRPRTPERSLPYRSRDRSSPYRSRDRSRERDRSRYSSGHYSREQGSRYRSRSREQEYRSGGRSHPRDFSKDRQRDFRSRSPCDVSPTPYRPDIKCTICHKIGYSTQDCWHYKSTAVKPALPKKHANISSSQAAVRQSEVTKIGSEEDKQFASKVSQDYQTLVTENADLRSKNNQLQRQVDQLRKKIDQVRNEGDSIIEQQGATLEKLNEQLQVARLHK